MTSRTPRIAVACSTLVTAGVAEPGSKTRRHQVPAPYVERVVEAGGLPLLLPVVDPDRAEAYLDLADGLLLIGGDDVDPSLYGAEPHPALGAVDLARDRFELALLRVAMARDLPTLGVCRGVQVMNVALGGTLWQDLPSEFSGALAHAGAYDASHDVDVVPGSRLAAILGIGSSGAGGARVAVNSHHHQALRRVAPTLAVTARSPDGVVEASELPSQRFFVGVQWHPERLPDAEATRRLFAAFVAEAARDVPAQAPAPAPTMGRRRS